VIINNNPLAIESNQAEFMKYFPRKYLQMIIIKRILKL